MSTKIHCDGCKKQIAMSEYPFGGARYHMSTIHPMRPVVIVYSECDYEEHYCIPCRDKALECLLNANGWFKREPTPESPAPKFEGEDALFSNGDKVLVEGFITDTPPELPPIYVTISGVRLTTTHSKIHPFPEPSADEHMERK